MVDEKNCYQICYQLTMLAKTTSLARDCTGQPLMHLLVDDSIIRCAFLGLCTIGASFSSLVEAKMYILIAVFITTSSVNVGAYKGVSFQEFETKETCEQAKTTTEKMFESVRGYPGSDAFSLKCVKK